MKKEGIQKRKRKPKNAANQVDAKQRKTLPATPGKLRTIFVSSYIRTYMHIYIYIVFICILYFYIYHVNEPIRLIWYESRFYLVYFITPVIYPYIQTFKMLLLSISMTNRFIFMINDYDFLAYEKLFKLDYIMIMSFREFSLSFTSRISKRYIINLYWISFKFLLICSILLYF